MSVTFKTLSYFFDRLPLPLPPAYLQYFEFAYHHYPFLSFKHSRIIHMVRTPGNTLNSEASNSRIIHKFKPLGPGYSFDNWIGQLDLPRHWRSEGIPIENHLFLEVYHWTYIYNTAWNIWWFYEHPSPLFARSYKTSTSNNWLFIFHSLYFESPYHQFH
jgi:hypothetical protein